VPNTHTITVKPGDYLDDIAQSAIEQAMSNDEQVKFIINGISIKVNKDDSLETIKHKYHKQRNSDRKTLSNLFD